MFKVFGIDNISGEVVWSHYIPDLMPWRHSKKDKIDIYLQKGASEAVLFGKNRVSIAEKKGRFW